MHFPTDARGVLKLLFSLDFQVACNCALGTIRIYLILRQTSELFSDNTVKSNQIEFKMSY